MGKRYTEPVKQPQAPKKEEPVIVEEKEELANGIVDCDTYLNIRREPEVKPNNQIAILGKGTKIIVVDPKKEIKNKDGEWLKIRIVDKEKDPKDPDNNGFAMKKFIKFI